MTAVVKIDYDFVLSKYISILCILYVNDISFYSLIPMHAYIHIYKFHPLYKRFHILQEKLICTSLMVFFRTEFLEQNFSEFYL